MEDKRQWKFGDRVRVTKGFYVGMVGELIRELGDGSYVIWFENQSFLFSCLSYDCFELLKLPNNNSENTI